MKFSFNWLREISQTKKNVEEITNLLITHSFEVEEIIDLSKNLKNVVVGEVLSKEKHPDAEKLNVAKINVGNEILQIVCGASNLEVGQKVPVALIGAKLPAPKNEEGIDFFEIKKAKLRGVESFGMICPEDELGLSGNHEGIMVLENSAEVGKSLADYLGLNDFILEVKILPDRGHDCLSYIGMAREIQTLDQDILENFKFQISNFEINFNDLISKLKLENPEITDDLDIKIETEKCYRYIGAKISDIKVSHSPKWLVDRLKVAGIKSINNVVDITNYVMLETGQPLHAFDFAKIHSISVRQAKNGEKLTLLDESEIELAESDIVITDGKNPVALAGIMGGKESGISEETTEILLESASFDYSSVRISKQKHNLNTDASYRFERDIDPNLTELATKRAITLFQEICGGKVQLIKDVYPNPIKNWQVSLSIKYVEKLLGVKISVEKIEEILHRSGIQTEKKNDEILICSIPTRRRDLQNQEDLIEEIGRIYGYEKIEAIPILGKIELPYKNEQRFFERFLKNICINCGFNEIKSYSFYSKDQVQAIGFDQQKHLSLLNPFNSEQEFMRKTLAVYLLLAGKKNLSYFDEVAIFEIGRIYDPVENSLPNEKLIFGASLAEKGEKGEQFFKLKGLIEVIFSRIGLQNYLFDSHLTDEEKQQIPALHPSRQAVIRNAKGEMLGYIGEASRSAHKFFGLKKMRAVICEMEVDKLMREIKTEKIYKSLPKFPFVIRDLSMLMKKKLEVVNIEKIIQKAGGELVRKIELFDLYENVENQTRSVAFHITFGNFEKTLQSEEVDEKMVKIMESLESELGVEVRR